MHPVWQVLKMCDIQALQTSCIAHLPYYLRHIPPTPPTLPPTYPTLPPTPPTPPPTPPTPTQTILSPPLPSLPATLPRQVSPPILPSTSDDGSQRCSGDVPLPPRPPPLTSPSPPPLSMSIGTTKRGRLESQPPSQHGSGQLCRSHPRLIIALSPLPQTKQPPSSQLQCCHRRCDFGPHSPHLTCPAPPPPLNQNSGPCQRGKRQKRWTEATAGGGGGKRRPAKEAKPPPLFPFLM